MEKQVLTVHYPIKNEREHEALATINNGIIRFNKACFRHTNIDKYKYARAGIVLNTYLLVITLSNIKLSGFVDIRTETSTVCKIMRDGGIGKHLGKDDKKYTVKEAKMDGHPVLILRKWDSKTQ